MLRYTLMSAMLLTMLLSLSAEAATKITAKAAYKNGKLNYSGSLKGAQVGTQVSVYDGETGLLLHTMQTNAKNAFSYALPIDNRVCNVKLVAGDAESVFRVTSAPSSCKTGLVCDVSANNLNAKVGDSISFNGKTLFKGNTLPEVTWDFGNGETKSGTATKNKSGAAASEPKSYNHAGRYQVSYSAKLNGSQCQDTTVVSVAPAANPPQVNETVTRPADGSGMLGDYAVIPFSDRSDVGVANDSPNQYLQVQSLNAIVYQKAPKKPVALGLDDLDVYYSAAINLNDPVGGDSINSTSQNWFVDGKAGANYDTAVENTNSRDDKVRVTTLLPNKYFFDGEQNDGVKKTGLYDRRSNRNNNGGSDMTRLTSGTTTLVTQLDEGARASKDLLANTQSMPGRAGAYSKNEEQKINAFDDLGMFTAQMLPVVGVDDKGRKNPFPLMRVTAKKDGENLAVADGALISSSEMSCAQCHGKGGISADDNNWFTPVTLGDAEAKGDGSSLGANSGSSYPVGRDGQHSTNWLAAIQNRFELKIISTTPEGKNTYQMVNPLNAAAANLRTDDQDALFKPIFVKKDGADHISNITNKPMILRGDRVKDYRFSADGKLQIQLNFVAPANDSPQAREKAAFLNMAILHDYYDSFRPTNAAAGGVKNFETQFADVVEDKTLANSANPTSCGGHHFSNANHDMGRSSIYNARIPITNYSRSMHAFHGRLQVYKEDVKADVSADGLVHSKGEVIRDKRGHHVPFGGAGWDPEKKDNYKLDVAGSYDGMRNDFDPVAFPMHAKGELLLPFDLKRGPEGEMLKQTLAANTGSTDMNANCNVCHAGKTEKVYHDMHYSAGLTCESCHGDMQAVGALWLKPGKNYTTHRAQNFRVFDWDQPNCESCHSGNKAEVGRLAFAAWDKSATSLDRDADTIDRRFAVTPNTLEIKRPGASGRPVNANGVPYDKVCLGTDGCDNVALNDSGELKEVTGTPLFRKSLDVHGNVPCAACHGPAHTIWPVNGVNSNHNVTAKQLQGYEGTLMECDVCHSKDGAKNSFADGLLASTEAIAYGKRGTLVKPTDSGNAYLAGPHGLHPINDENWYKHAVGAAPSQKPKMIKGLEMNGGWHNDMAKKPGPNGEDQCAACHGADHKGTRLSRTLVNRTFTNEKGKPVKVAAGSIIGCGTCHSLKKSFNGVPTGQPKTSDLPSTPIAKPADDATINDPVNTSTAGTGGGTHNH